MKTSNIHKPKKWSSLFQEWKKATRAWKLDPSQKCAQAVAKIENELASSQKEPTSYRLDSFYCPLYGYKWHGMISLRFEAMPWAANSEYGEQDRKTFAKRMMGCLRREWDLNRNDILWAASTEFGISGKAHIHLIFSFDPIRAKPIPIPGHQQVEEDLQEAISFLASEYGQSANAFDAHYAPAYYDKGLVAYVCTLEEGQDSKDFIWSKDLTKWRRPTGEEVAN